MMNLTQCDFCSEDNCEFCHKEINKLTKNQKEVIMQIKMDAINEFANWLEKEDYLNRVDIVFDHDVNGFEITTELVKEEVIKEYLEQLKEVSE